MTIFLVCYNEVELLPHTVKHYTKYLPGCRIVIYDNFSTDNSREVARALGCEVRDYDTSNIIDDYKLRDLKNNCWKGSSGWVIVCDMDEWLCITNEDLERECGTVLQVVGFNIVADSERSDISDIDPLSCSFGIRNPWLDKRICFRADKIKEMNFNCGAHQSDPKGEVKYGNHYLLKHMNFLGLSNKLSRNRIRYERSELMRKKGMARHYVNDDNIIINNYALFKKNRIELKEICPMCFD